jgi:pyruvate dehydrogenase E2 component (dihydrolipoamide acetyltransferase)
MTRVQRAIARRMTASAQEIPTFVTELEVDMTAVDRFRRERDHDGGRAPSFNDFVIKATARALKAVPQLNSSFAGDHFTFHGAINVGMAVTRPGALLVPTIFEADRKSLEQIATCAASLSARVRDGSIRAEELAGGTFTVSNLGMLGVDRFTAIINPPQAGILAVGAVRDRVIVDHGAPQIAKRMTATLTADHRIVYGADAAEFLNAFRGILESWGGDA